jgi:hypothetical protein
MVHRKFVGVPKDAYPVLSAWTRKEIDSSIKQITIGPVPSCCAVVLPNGWSG